MRKRILVALAMGALLAAVLPGITSARPFAVERFLGPDYAVACSDLTVTDGSRTNVGRARIWFDAGEVFATVDMRRLVPGETYDVFIFQAQSNCFEEPQIMDTFTADSKGRGRTRLSGDVLSRSSGAVVVVYEGDFPYDPERTWGTEAVDAP